MDGQAKFDLTQLNQAYFDRMRQRVIAAGNRGIYVSIMLFDGWSVDPKDPSVGGGQNNPWKGHPYNPSNNINGIDGDTNNDDKGTEIHTLSGSYITSKITPLQEAYVRKVIDTVNDLDNVLYEVCNECGLDSKDWQSHMVNYIHTYEQSKPKQHPVGINDVGDANLFSSPADWVSPSGSSYFDNPPIDNHGKVVMSDTDHICGVCGDRAWVWKTFMRGHNPIFMDPYDGAGYGVGGAGFVFNDPRWVSARANMGYILTYATRINLPALTPTSNTSLCSTSYCLRNAVANGAEYLVYRPGNSGNITVDLSAVSSSKALNVEWFNPATGMIISGGTVNGGASRSLTPPFSNDAILYIYDAIVVSFVSDGTNDGWLRESSETSGKANTLNSTNAILRVGDDAANRQFRAILSFDTSSLPDNAIIASAILKFKYAGKVGTLPFSAHGKLMADICEGAFTGEPTLEPGDFNAKCPGGFYKIQALIYGNIKIDNWYSKSLAPSDFQYINLGGATQFRLRFNLDDNNDFGADQLLLYSGNAADQGIRPVLEIKYYIP